MNMFTHHKTTFYRLLSIGLLLMLGACIPEEVDNSSTNPASNLLPGSLIQSGAGDAAGDCIGIGEPSTSIRENMLDAINNYRAEYGLSPLIYSKRLERAVSQHVQDCWSRNFFDHTNPDGDGPADRAMDTGFCHPYVGENLAAGQRSVAEVMEGWKNSPGHNQNLLHPDFVYVGMGHFVDPNGRQYWGQAFAMDE